jgi:hypothetical protein
MTVSSSASHRSALTHRLLGAHTGRPQIHVEDAWARPAAAAPIEAASQMPGMESMPGMAESETPGEMPAMGGMPTAKPPARLISSSSTTAVKVTHWSVSPPGRQRRQHARNPASKTT